MCSKPKVVEAAPPPPPAPTPTSADIGAGNAEAEATKKQRRKKGFEATQVATDRTILGAVQEGSSALKKTLG